MNNVFLFLQQSSLLKLEVTPSLEKPAKKMSSASELNRKRRPHKMFLILTDLKVQDHLDGTIRLQRGFMCQEQDKSRSEFLWVKVFTT